MDSAAVAVAPEVTEFRRQVTVGDLCGDVIKDVIARGLRKRRISRRGVLNLDTQRVDAALKLEARHGTDSSQTPRWRKADSNPRFRDALAPPTALPWCDAA